MNLLFVYGEARVIYDEEGQKYINGTITTNTWNERYKVLGKVTFVSKKDRNIYSSKDAKNKFSVIDEEVDCVCLKDNTQNIKSYFSNAVRKYNNEILENLVKKSDFVIARIPSDYSYVAIDYAKKYNKPYMVEVVGCSFDSYWNHGLSGKILAIPKFLKLKKYIKNSKYLVYVSNEFLQKRYPSLGQSISCSNVVLNEVNDDCLKKRIEKIKHMDKNDTIVFGTCGGIDVSYKGQQYVIKALSILKKNGFNKFEYQVVGGGTGEILKKLAIKYGINEEFKIIGSLPHNKVLEWMDNLDIYIQPSNQEGLCRSIIEAESRACPVIASDAGGNPELINNEYIFKRKNIKMLAKCIENMTQNKMLTEAKNNFNNSKQYQKDILIDKRREFYDIVLGEKDK